MATRKNDDLLALWNQAYPEASTAPTNTLAQSQRDVNSMSAADRLWDSMNYTYGQQRQASDQSYNQAISQTDRQALGRGMQRSSYNNATLGNLRNKQIEAQNNIYSQQIADYENRLNELERQEKQDEQWERQFAENTRQFNENLGFQRERADVGDTQWQKQFDEGNRQWQAQFDTGNQQWERQFENSNQQWEKQFAESARQFNAQMGNNWMNQILAMGGSPSDELLAQIGLSRADYNAMVTQLNAGGGGGGGSSGSSGGSKKTTTTTPPAATDKNLQALVSKDTVKTIGTTGAAPAYVGPSNNNLGSGSKSSSNDYVASKPVGGFLTRGFESLKKK